MTDERPVVPDRAGAGPGEPYALGVDIGTTFTGAAIARRGHVEPLTLGTAATVIPSVVAMRPDGEVLVGEAADRRGAAEPDRIAREFKRRLGDPTPVVIGGTPYGVEALMARVLRAVVDLATDRQGEPPAAIVVTHPASYGPYKRDLLVQMARLAGVGPVTFLTEPEAAAIDYVERNRLGAGGIVAVYDFGGGTFDAAVLRKTETGFELLGEAEGIERLGGIDFDHAVFAHTVGALGGLASEAAADAGARAALARLRADARAGKEALSVDSETAIPVILPNVQTEVRLTRPEFEAMIRPRVTETIAALERAVRSAGVTMADIERILLVGGSSRIPLVGEIVRQATGRPIAIDADPKLAIALGAARAGWLALVDAERESAAGATAAGAAVTAASTAAASGVAAPAPSGSLEPGSGAFVRAAVAGQPRRATVPPAAIIGAAALAVAGAAFALGGGNALFPAETGAPTTGPTTLVTAVPAASSTATVASTPATGTALALPPEVDAAFCRFGTELTGPWAATNDALARAIDAGDIPAMVEIGGAFEASVLRMRADLAIAATWPPLTSFATEMSAALQAYQDAIGIWVADPNSLTHASLTQAAARVVTIGSELPRLLSDRPELGC